MTTSPTANTGPMPELLSEGSPGGHEASTPQQGDRFMCQGLGNHPRMMRIQSPISTIAETIRLVLLLAK